MLLSKAVLKDGLSGFGEANILENNVVAINMNRLLVHNMIAEHIERVSHGGRVRKLRVNHAVEPIIIISFVVVATPIRIELCYHLLSGEILVLVGL